MSSRSEYRDITQKSVEELIDKIENDVNEVIRELENINDNSSILETLDYVDIALTRLKDLSNKLY